MSGVRLLLRILSALTLPAAITLATPHGLCAQGTSGGTQAQNVRAERSGSIVDISYDLPDAAGAVFSVTIEVSSNGGQSFDIKPTSTTGDIGATIGAGRGKKISWDSAKDVDTLQFDQYRFRVNAVRVDVPPPPPPPKPSTGSLVVRSTPSGAAVSIDGQARGATPVTINELAVGSHRIIVSKDGYLENSSQVTVEQSKTAVVEKQLTAAPAPPKQTGGGSNPAKWIIPVAAGGAVGAALALKGSGTTPPPTVPCTFAVVQRSDSSNFTSFTWTFPSGGGFGFWSITVSPAGCSNPSWTTSTNTSWVTFSPQSGTGNGVVETGTLNNPTTSDRTANVTIAGQTTVFFESGLPCTYTFAATDKDPTAPNPTWTVPAATGASARHVGVTTNLSTCPWTTSASVPWLHLAPASGTGSTASGPAQGVTVTWDSNTTGAVRAGVITFTGGTTSTAFNVTQGR